MSAEQAYMFRHAVLRDAAYAMQVPSDRARLHLAAADIIEIEVSHGGADFGAIEVADHLASVRAWRDSPALRQRESAATRKAAEFAERQFNHRDALRLWQRLAAISRRAHAADALRRAGRVAIQSGESGLAEPLLRRALKLARAAREKNTECLALGSLGNLYQQTGRLLKAAPLHERALAILRKLGERRHEGIELGNLANLYARARQPDKAEPLYAQTIAIHREVGNRLGEAVALGNLAGLYQESGREAQAEELYRKAMPILEALNDKRSIGIALSNLGNLYASTQRDELALKTLSRALRAVRETGNRRYEGIVLGSIAMVHVLSGQAGTALPLLEAALEIHAEVRNLTLLGAHGCDLGLCLLALGRHEEAAARWRQSEALLREVGDSGGAKAKRESMVEACHAANVAPF